MSLLRAGLPMYRRPETAPALDLLWGIIRDGIVARGAALAEDLPETLEVPRDLEEFWLSPALILGQCCSLPFRTVLRDKVAYVATLDYGLPGCAPGYYNSVLVTRRGSPAAGILACNAQDSQSGWAAAQEMIGAGAASASGQLATGAHLESARAVAEGRADWACIDAQSWAMLHRWEALTGKLEVRARSTPTPALPLICAPGQDSEALAEAVEEAVPLLDAASRDTLGLRGAVRLRASDYLALPIPRTPAA